MNVRYCILMFCLLFTAISRSQNADAYPFPQRVQVGNLSPGIPNSLRDPDENPAASLSPYIENFHPVGWSADGKAAYMSWGEKVNGSYFGVIVYDAVKDTIAGKWFEDMSGMSELDKEQIPSFWKRDKDSIQHLLDHFHIIPYPVQQLENLPFTLRNGYRYEIEFTLQQHDGNDRYYDAFSASCVITSSISTDTVAIHASGFHALDIQPASIWFSPDHQFALLLGYTETPQSESIENPHYFYYFLRTVRLH